VEVQIVNKVDIASRQIREAIRLFFERRDEIAIYTIVASSHQILVDLGNSMGVTSFVKNTAALRKEEVQSFLKTINYPYNFFKHADRDPDGTINLGPLKELTPDLLLDAVVMLQRVAGRIPTEAKIYWTWFVSQYPDGFLNLPEDGEVAKLQSLQLGALSFDEIVQLIQLAEVTEGADA
jgi:hypothetical protein